MFSISLCRELDKTLVEHGFAERNAYRPLRIDQHAFEAVFGIKRLQDRPVDGKLRPIDERHLFRRARNLAVRLEIGDDHGVVGHRQPVDAARDGVLAVADGQCAHDRDFRPASG